MPGERDRTLHGGTIDASGKAGGRADRNRNFFQPQVDDVIYRGAHSVATGGDRVIAESGRSARSKIVILRIGERRSWVTANCGPY